MNSKQLEQFIIEVIDDKSNQKLEQLVSISKAGVNYNDKELTGNFADICRHIFHTKVKSEPMTLEQKDWYRKWVICYKIIIRHNPHLLKNKTYVGNGGITIFDIELILLVTSCGYFNSCHKVKIHDDYLDTEYEIFMFNTQYINYDNDLYITMFSLSRKYKNKYQSQIIKILFEEYKINQLLNAFNIINNLPCAKIIDKYQNLECVNRYTYEENELLYDDFYSYEGNQDKLNQLINNYWYKIFITNKLEKNINDDYYLKQYKCSPELYNNFLTIFSESKSLDCKLIEIPILNVILSSTTSLINHINYYTRIFIKSIFNNVDLEIFNVIKIYSWFIPLIIKYKLIPNDDNDFLQLLSFKKFRKVIVNSNIFIFDSIRRRRIKVLKYLWRLEKASILQLKNNKGQNVLEYAKNCRGLMHNIINLLSK